MHEALRENPEVVRAIAAMQPRYRYYIRKSTGDRYFWTTEKANHNGKPRFIAGIYRWYKTKKQFKLVRSVGFAKRYKAKQWALAAFNREATV